MYYIKLHNIYIHNIKHCKIKVSNKKMNFNNKNQKKTLINWSYLSTDM